MKIALGAASLRTTADVLAVAVTENDFERDDYVRALDAELGGELVRAAKNDEWTGKKDTMLVVSTLGKTGARKVALVGMGPGRSVGEPEIRIAAAKSARWAQAERAESLEFTMPKRTDARRVRIASEGIVLGAYRFIKYMTGERIPKKDLGKVTLGLRPSDKHPFKPGRELLEAIDAGIAVGNAVNLARDLVNEPPNVLTPKALADHAVEVAKRFKMKITVLDPKGCIDAGMKLIDAVGRGSSNGPRFVHMTYTPSKVTKKTRKIAVVGKGLTFDSGGLCIKPAQGMGDMKCDMAGAAISVGVMAAVGALAPDVEVHGIFAAVENMPDGNAYRPGDIFGSLDGKTVEIINTDAEGRLVLADALAYARKLKPDVLIDHATLTGACMVALGTLTCGLYANDDRLGASYLTAAKRAGESMWRLPLIEELREGLKSDVADLKHTADRFGGSITAALFLREFVGDCKWMHLDIAGPAFLDRPTPLAPKGGTGFGVLTLTQFIESMK